MKLTQAHIHMNAHSHPSLSLGTFFVVLHSSLTRGPTNSVRSDRSFPLSSIPQALAIPLCHSLFVYTEALPNTSARQWRSCTEANTFRRCCWSYIVVCRYIFVSRTRVPLIFSIQFQSEIRIYLMHGTWGFTSAWCQPRPIRGKRTPHGWCWMTFFDSHSLVVVVLIHACNWKHVGAGCRRRCTNACVGRIASVGSLLCECCNDDVFVSWIVHKHTNTRTVCLCTVRCGTVSTCTLSQVHWKKNYSSNSTTSTTMATTIKASEPAHSCTKSCTRRRWTNWQ